MTRVFWVRHGENVANLSRTFSHRVFDGALTPRGRDQADALAEALAFSPTRFGGIWVSPLRRAQQTAEILGQRLDINLTGELEELRELNVGELDGRSDPDAWTAYEEVLTGWRSGDLHQRFPGGENGVELAERVALALRRTVRDVTTEAVLVVAHGANIRAALPTLTGEPEPGSDLATGAAAQLDIERDAITLRHWPSD